MLLSGYTPVFWFFNNATNDHWCYARQIIEQIVDLFPQSRAKKLDWMEAEELQLLLSVAYTEIAIGIEKKDYNLLSDKCHEICITCYKIYCK